MRKYSIVFPQILQSNLFVSPVLEPILLSLTVYSFYALDIISHLSVVLPSRLKGKQTSTKHSSTLKVNGRRKSLGND